MSIENRLAVDASTNFGHLTVVAFIVFTFVVLGVFDLGMPIQTTAQPLSAAFCAAFTVSVVLIFRQYSSRPDMGRLRLSTLVHAIAPSKSDDIVVSRQKYVLHTNAPAMRDAMLTTPQRNEGVSQ